MTKKILLTALAWVSKVPTKTVSEIYNQAEAITTANDAEQAVSGWEKLKGTVSYLADLFPAGPQEIAKIVITIIVNFAVLAVRIKALKK